MLSRAYAAALLSIQARLVTVEVNCLPGSYFHLVGLPDTSVKESQDRVATALINSGYKYPNKHIIINLSPADIRKEGSAYDLPIAIALLAADEQVSIANLEQYLIIGELMLDGTLRPIKGALPIAIEAKAQGVRGLILPLDNAEEAAVVDGIEVYGARTLKDVVHFLNEGIGLESCSVDVEELFRQQQIQSLLDFAEVKGQEGVKRALEVAAAGGHNMLMVGAPGSGKSMMAKRLPSILPPFTMEESLETSKVYSVVGKLNRETMLMTQRPFRAPHHSISPVALVGGGSNPQPGEISLAHNGVLFLDELPEFNRSVLEVMRQPLEDRAVTVARARFTVDYPAGFMLIAAMNPCPCGYYNHPTRACECSPQQVQRYLAKVSGPLLDRIDLQVEISPVDFDKLSALEASESSACIRERVVRARAIQNERFASYPNIHCNAQMTSKMMQVFARPDEKGLARLKTAMERLSLSARAYDRIIKVARTIADLEGTEQITQNHISEAIGYRSLDRSSWGEKLMF